MNKRIKKLFCVLGCCLILVGCTTEEKKNEDKIKVEEEMPAGTPGNEDIMEGLKESMNGLFE